THVVVRVAAHLHQLARREQLFRVTRRLHEPIPALYRHTVLPLHRAARAAQQVARLRGGRRAREQREAGRHRAELIHLVHPQRTSTSTCTSTSTGGHGHPSAYSCVLLSKSAPRHPAR